MEKTIERTQGDFYHLQVFFLAEKTRIQLYNRCGFQLVDCTVDKLTVYYTDYSYYTYYEFFCHQQEDRT